MYSFEVRKITTKKLILIFIYRQNLKMICQAIIKVGKNKGKFCGRTECFINGHDKYVKGKGKCRQIIFKGRNKGTMCGRIKCYFHYDIADYLELPMEFRNRKLCIHGYNALIPLIEYDSNNLDIKYVLIDLLSYIDKEEVPLIQELITIIIFKLIDTKSGVSLRLKYKKFNNVVQQKLIEFQNPDYVISDAFKKYINNLETGKTYLCKRKNILNKFKLYILYVGSFIKIYKKVKEKRNSLCIIS